MTDDALPDQDLNAERLARHQAILKELADIGLDMARAVQRQAQGTDRKAKVGLDRSFKHIARAVRLTLALETRMAEDGFAEGQRLATERQAQRARRQMAERLDLAQRKARVRHLVVEAIEIEADETKRPEPAENLLDALDIEMERLSLSDRRPVGEIVAGICKTLGVAIDLTGVFEAPQIQEDLRAQPAGSPFANGPPDPVWPDRTDREPPRRPDPRVAPERRSFRRSP